MQGPVQLHLAVKKLIRVCDNHAHPQHIAPTTHNPFHGSRLLVRDPLTDLLLLIDTGADLSALPKSQAENLTPDSLCLYAANGTRIETFGRKSLTLSLGLDSTYSWDFIIADVGCPIIGADFLHSNHIMVDLRGGKLMEGRTLQTIKCHIPTTNTPRIKILQINAPYNAILN